MKQISLRLPEELRKMAERYAKRHGYKNLQELAKESIRMRIRSRTEEGEYLWKELPEETRKGIDEISKLSKTEWNRWYRKIKAKEKERAKLLMHHS